MPSRADGLARLLGTVDAATFLEDHWEQRHLLVRAADPWGFEDLFSLADMDRLLGCTPLSHDRVRVVREGVTPFPDHGRGGGEPHLEQVYAEFRQGASVVLLGVGDQSEPVGRLGRSLASAFSARIQTNAYLTPRSARALKAHYDTHDVFVLQTHGSKRWWIGPRAVALPLPEPPWLPQHHEDDQIADGVEFDLEPGDALYIPRGTLHRAVSRDSASLHLTVGVHPVTWAAVLRAALDDVIERDEECRRALPIGFADDPGARELAVRQLTEKLRTVTVGVDADTIVRGVAASARAGRPPELAGHLLDLEDAPRVDADTVVRRRPGLDWTLSEHGEEISLSFHQKKITVPARVRESLTFVTEVDDDFTPADLSGLLEPESAVRLTRRLLVEGFLTTRSAGHAEERAAGEVAEAH